MFNDVIKSMSVEEAAKVARSLEDRAGAADRLAQLQGRPPIQVYLCELGEIEAIFKRGKAIRVNEPQQRNKGWYLDAEDFHPGEEGTTTIYIQEGELGNRMFRTATLEPINAFVAYKQD
ncbi:MAG: hypothetical protein AABX70_05520 [Nanoarchaeota archaeon]